MKQSMKIAIDYLIINNSTTFNSNYRIYTANINLDIITKINT